MEKQWAKDMNRHFRGKKIRIDQERNTYTSLIKLKLQQFGNNSTVGKDVDK